MEVDFELKKIKKDKYKLIIFVNRNKYNKIFYIDKVRLLQQSLYSGYTHSQVMHYSNSIFNSLFADNSAFKNSFIEKYSKIETIQSLAKYINVNEFKLEFDLKKYGLVDENELIFNSKNIEKLKEYLMTYFDSIDIFNKLA